MSAASGGGPEHSFAEYLKNMISKGTAGNAERFIDKFGEHPVDPLHIIPCCSLYYTEETLELVKTETEKLKKDDANPTLNECLDKIVDDEYVGPHVILKHPIAKMLCLTAVFGNHWKDILEIKDRTDLWDSLNLEELPREWVVSINSHGNRIDKLTPGNFTYNHTTSYVSTACPGSSAFYNEKHSIIDPEIILNDEVRDEHLIKRSDEYLDSIGESIEKRMKDYDDLQLQKIDAFKEYNENPTRENILKYGEIKSEIDDQKNNLKSLVKIFKQNKSHESYLEQINYFERFLYGDEKGGKTGLNTTIVSLIPKESAELTNFLEKYFRIKLAEEHDDETQYYTKISELLRITPINDWTRMIQEDKIANPTYAFAFNGSKKLNKLQTPMIELAIAIAHKTNKIGFCMCLSSFIFSNMENAENTIIDRLLRSDDSYRIRFGVVSLLLDNLTLQQVIFDNSCKGGHVDVRYKYQKAFPDLDFGNSQDQNTQDMLESVSNCNIGGKCVRACRAFQKGECDKGSECRFIHDNAGNVGGIKSVCAEFQKTGKCSRGSFCRLSHKGGKSKKKGKTRRRRQHKKSTKKRK